MVKIHVRAPGKLILLGEYAVLEGGNALVAAVDACSTVALSLTSDPSSRLHAPQIGLENAPFQWSGGEMVWPEASDEALKSKLVLVETVLAHFYNEFELQFENRGIELEINTEEFFSQEANCKLGLGSSASVCVGLTAAFISLLTKQSEVDLNDVYALAFKLHRDAQGGVGSGVDIAASVFGGYLEFSPGGNSADLPTVHSLVCPSELHILPIFTGESAGTVDLVQQVYSFRDAEEEEYRRLLDGLQELAAEGGMRFQTGDCQAFLRTVTDFSQGLDALGEASNAPIISTIHRQVKEAVGDTGGTYKISGAGGGDFGLAFFVDQQLAEAAKRSLKSDGWVIPSLAFGCGGVQVDFES